MASRPPEPADDALARKRWTIIQVTRFAGFALVLIGFGFGMARPGFTSAASLAVTSKEQGAVAGILSGASATGAATGGGANGAIAAGAGGSAPPMSRSRSTPSAGAGWESIAAALYWDGDGSTDCGIVLAPSGSTSLTCG